MQEVLGELCPSPQSRFSFNLSPPQKFLLADVWPTLGRLSCLGMAGKAGPLA